MRDLTEQLYDLVAEKRRTLPQSQSQAAPPAPAEGSISFAVTANHIAEEILRVNEAVLRDNKHFLRHMCCGVEVDDGPLRETEQLLAGAAQHVDQLQALIDAAAAAHPMNTQQLAHLHTIVAGLYGLLQECSGPFTALQAAHHSLQQQAAAFRRGPAARPRPAPVTAGVEAKLPTAAASVPVTNSQVFEEPVLTDGEAHQLEQEHLELKSHLNDLSTEILEVEATAQSLSALAGLFATKVEEQNSQIAAIHKDAQESTDFVKQAARHITQATKHGVSFRFLILIALVGGSIILLALHAIVP